eukprot:SM000111S18760  [mRNA]  locus=s111:31031:37051:+ [translate_table: standard]
MGGNLQETVVCDPARVAEVVQFLAEQGLEAQEAAEVVRAFPHALACDVERLCRPNASVLEREWGIKGPMLKRAILRQPSLLGFAVDCKGDCVAECDRCWARF